MTLYKSWNNYPSAQPQGICEASCVNWLNLIQNLGARLAADSLGSIIDPIVELQRRIESGTWTWALNLGDVVDGVSINPFERSRMEEKFEDIDNMMAVLSQLSPNKFVILAAERPRAGNAPDSHANAVYRSASQFWYFDPDEGFFYGDQATIIQHIFERLVARGYTSIAATTGTFSRTPPSN